MTSYFIGAPRINDKTTPLSIRMKVFCLWSCFPDVFFIEWSKEKCIWSGRFTTNNCKKFIKTKI